MKTSLCLAYGQTRSQGRRVPGDLPKHESSLQNLVATKELTDGLLGHLNLRRSGDGSA